MRDNSPAEPHLDHLPDNEAGKGTASSPEDIQTKGRAQTAAVKAAQDASAAETTDLAPMMDWVMSKADIEAQTCFGVDIPDGLLPVGVAEILCQLKAEMGLPLENLSDEAVAKLLGKRLQVADSVANRDIDDAANEASATSLQDYQEALTTVADKPNIEKILALMHDERVPPAERVKLEAFAQIMAIANRVPQDAAVVTQRLNTLDFSRGVPSHFDFIQTAIFSSPDVDTGVSDATQTAIATAFNLPKERLVSGTDLARAADRTVIDAVTGQERPLYDDDNKLLLHETPSAAGNVYLHIDKQGDRVIEVTLSDGRHRELSVPNSNPGELRTWTAFFMVYAQLEEDGQTDFMGEGIGIETAITSLRDPIKRQKLELTLNALLGGSMGYDGRIPTAEDMQRIGYYVNYLGAGKGDAQIGDVSHADAIERRTKLGIHPPGDPQTINYDILHEACRYMDAQKYLGAPDYDALQNHLHKLFPNQVAKA